MICEVKEYGDGFVVNLQERTCTCEYFNLSEIPCVHAVAPTSFLCLQVEPFVQDLYTISQVSKAYGVGLPATVGRQAWPEADVNH
ncbi:hypothetical protein LINPERHAP2_LOCUS22763 [Linum perenne]